jgi:DNA-binding CsgD family transcriptional regulator
VANEQGPKLNENAQSSTWLILNGVSTSIWSYELSTEPQVMGRDDQCEIVLYHPKVSRRHAQLTLEGDGVRVEDLKSRNGTFLQGTRLTSTVVPIGTEIRIGELTLSIVNSSRMQQGAFASTIETVSAAYLDTQQIGALSVAQIRVLRKLLDGRGESDIAKELFLSPATVHTHVKAIYKQMNVQSRAGLLAKFIDPGVLKTLEAFRP